MQNSGYDHERAVLKGRAEGYALTTRKAEYIDMSFPHAAGGLYSTVEDLYLWDQALYAEELVSRETLDRIFTDYGAQYGYGWVVAGAEGSRVLAHSGGIDGFASFIGRYVDRPATMIILSNLESIPFSLEMLQKMLLSNP